MLFSFWLLLVAFLAVFCIFDTAVTLSKISKGEMSVYSLQWAFVRTALLFTILSGTVFAKIGFDIGIGQ